MRRIAARRQLVGGASTRRPARLRAASAASIGEHVDDAGLNRVLEQRQETRRARGCAGCSRPALDSSSTYGMRPFGRASRAARGGGTRAAGGSTASSPRMLAAGESAGPGAARAGGGARSRPDRCGCGRPRRGRAAQCRRAQVEELGSARRTGGAATRIATGDGVSHARYTVASARSTKLGQPERRGDAQGRLGIALLRRLAEGREFRWLKWTTPATRLRSPASARAAQDVRRARDRVRSARHCGDARRPGLGAHQLVPARRSAADARR